MRYYLPIAMAIAYSSLLWSQTERIAFQGFEEIGSSWGSTIYSTPPCMAGDDIWNRVSALGGISPNEGNAFWGVQDLNGECGSSGFEWIELPSIDVSRHQNVVCLLDYQVIGFDAGDDIELEPWFNGEAQERILLVDGANDFSTQGWTEASIGVPNRVSDFKLRIYIKQNGTDQAGFDNIRLEGVPISPCSDLFISEYVEGSSSRTHRNNFIEIYNPGTDPVSLEGFQLAKYTGSSTEPSSVLGLSGTISSFGTFLIEDESEILGIPADLSTNNAVMDFNGDDKIALTYGSGLVDLIGVVGDSLDFGRDLTLRRKSLVQGPNSEFDLDEWDRHALEQVDNLNAHQSLCTGPQPEIEIYGNGVEIPDGSNRSRRNDNTYFGLLDIASPGSAKHSFLIRNSGTSALEIDRIELVGEHKDDFQIDNASIAVLDSNESLELRIGFFPTGMGVRNALLRVHSNDPSEGVHDFLLQGEGTSYTDGALMITTYYEGQANNRWIEITNHSGHDIEEGTYFLALYRQDLLNSPIGTKPSVKKAVPFMKAGATTKYRASLNVVQPAYALDGSEISTAVCGFNGDDVLIISSSDGESCWEDRIDLIGTIGSWGTDIAYVRKYGCEQENPNSGFDPSHWRAYSPDEIDMAEPGQNERLGEYYLGETVFRSGTWSNGIPNFQRRARIEDDYILTSQDRLEVCDLEVGPGSLLRVEDGKYVAIKNDLYVFGSLEVMPGGDLLMIENSGRVENRGNISIHRSSSPLNPKDYTYWSSPVRSADLAEIFRESDPRFIFSFATASFSDNDSDGEDDTGEAWIPSSGRMDPGQGYAVIAPTGIVSGLRQYVTFQGEVNNGSIRLPIELQSDENSLNDWNLIGNPYPSVLDAELLMSDPNNAGLLSGTLYFWTHNTPLRTNDQTGEHEYASSDYAMYTVGMGGTRASSGGVTPDRYLASGQGFFVEAQAAGSLRFDNAMRTAGVASHFFKSTREKQPDTGDRIWLNLDNDRGAFSQILIGFKKEASKGFDPRFDGRRFSANANVDFYSVLDSLHLAIRGEPAFRGQAKIPLGLQVKTNGLGNFQISIDRLEGSLRTTPVYLYDQTMGVVHELNQESYSFAAPDPGVFDERFVLLLGNQVLSEGYEQEEANGIIWNFENDDLVIRTSKNDVIREIWVYDLLGRTLMDLHPSERIIRIPGRSFASNAIYILRVWPENSNELTTKFLHLRP